MNCRQTIVKNQHWQNVSPLLHLELKAYFNLLGATCIQYLGLVRVEWLIYLVCCGCKIAYVPVLAACWYVNESLVVQTPSVSQDCQQVMFSQEIRTHAYTDVIRFFC